MTSWDEAERLFQEADPEFASWTADQIFAFNLWTTLSNQRMLLFYPTGKGKTKLSLGLIAEAGFDSVLVVAPPKTHAAWMRDAVTLNLDLTVISVEAMRMKHKDTKDDFKFKRGVPIIVDEFHLLGKHSAEGFKKLDRNATGFPAIILASATPQYNDAERAYCIAHVLDPVGNLGGYQQWVIKHCKTRVNPFASTPYVDGFLNYTGAAEFLVDQGYTAYIEDDAEWEEQYFDLASHRDDWFETYGYDRWQHRMIASDMEAYHRRTYLDRVNPETGYLWDDVLVDLVHELDRRDRPWLVFCQHATIADAVARSLIDTPWASFCITGGMSHKQSEQVKHWFLELDQRKKVLVGTGTLSTGVDGLDRECDQLLVFDDLRGDHAKRRQVIGRVLPRGTRDRATRVVYAQTL